MSTSSPLRQRGCLRLRAFPGVTELGAAACLWFHIGIGHAVGCPAANWPTLAALPDAHGIAGAFAGVSGGALLVAGGANFPNRKPWEGGTKVWHDTIFALDPSRGQWRAVGKLPSPLGYGVAASHRRGMVCVGGSDARQHHASTLLLKWKDGQLAIEPLAGTPQPFANISGALAGDRLYVAGGTATPDATNALNSCFSMNLSARRPGWRRLEPIPGPGRILAVAGVLGNSFYLFSGAALKPGPAGKPEREWLRDAYRYTPGKGWKRLADLPRAAVAAPSPAPVVNGRLLILGGDDGTQADTPPADHKGFPRDVLAYDPKTDQWERLGEVPFSLVTTSAVEWNGRIVIPGGETRPGVRSTETWSLEIKEIEAEE